MPHAESEGHARLCARVGLGPRSVREKAQALTQAYAALERQQGVRTRRGSGRLAGTPGSTPSTSGSPKSVGSPC